MAKVTVIFAALLIVLGCVGYFGTTPSPAESGAAASAEETSGDTAEQSDPAKRSVTALIPAFVGGILLIFGLLAFRIALVDYNI